MTTGQQPSSGVETGYGYNDEKPDSEHEDRGRTYCGYEADILEHRAVSRYSFCLDYITPNDICLDAACGSGYGTELISQKAKKVIGLDVSDHALDYANTHHKNNKIEYGKADITRNIDYPDGFFDVIVSVETLEHITVHEELIRQFDRVLKPGGLFIATTVDHEVYSILGGIENKFHIGELTKKELIDLIRKFFIPEELHGQIKYQPLSRKKQASQRLWSRITDILRRLDVFDIRFFILHRLRLGAGAQNIERQFTTMVETEIEKLSLDGDEKYYQLLVVARKPLETRGVN